MSDSVGGLSRGQEFAFSAVLVLVMALGIVLAPALGALGPFLIDDLGLQRSQIGLLSSAAFLVSALFAPTLGRRIDQFVGPHLLTLVFCFVGGGLVSFALAPSFFWLL